MKNQFNRLHVLLVAIACLAISGCSNQQQNGTVIGGAAGAGVGAGVGAAAAGVGSRGAGAAVGGVIGLVAGGVIGAALTADNDKNAENNKNKTHAQKNNKKCDDCCAKRTLRAHSSCETCHCENK